MRKSSIIFDKITACNCQSFTQFQLMFTGFHLLGNAVKGININQLSISSDLSIKANTDKKGIGKADNTIMNL